MAPRLLHRSCAEIKLIERRTESAAGTSGANALAITPMAVPREGGQLMPRYIGWLIACALLLTAQPRRPAECDGAGHRRR